MRMLQFGRGWLLLAACGVATACEPPGAAKVPPATYRRTTFLGDSITDGNTYPLLIQSALRSAGLPPMVGINAGVGGDTAAKMAARLRRDVLAFEPTLVTLSAGANDAYHDVPPRDYERSVRDIADRLRRERIPLVLLTPCPMGGELRKKCERTLAGYEAVVRRVAAEYGLRVAEVRRRMDEAEAAGKPQMEGDNIHPTYEGQRSIARAVLDSLGYADVPVPARPEVEPLPGLITDWAVRTLPEGVVLTERNVPRIRPTDFPARLALPEAEPAETPWLDDYRKQGVSVSLKAKLGGAGPFVGRAILPSDRRKPVSFHTGADLRKVWLDGRLIYEARDLRGFHPGRESVAAELKPGDNVVIIETGPTFFLSVTDGPMWPPDPR